LKQYQNYVVLILHIHLLESLIFSFSASYLLNTRVCPILRLNLDIKYLWWPVQLRCHSWNTFCRYGCGCAGQLELLVYAVVRDILIAIYKPLSGVKSMFFRMFCVLWREHLKVFYLEDRASIFLKKMVLTWHWYMGEQNMNSESWAVCFARWSRQQENDDGSYQSSNSSSK
jgi:hypothetical protein